MYVFLIKKKRGCDRWMQLFFSWSSEVKKHNRNTLFVVKKPKWTCCVTVTYDAVLIKVSDHFSLPWLQHLKNNNLLRYSILCTVQAIMYVSKQCCQICIAKNFRVKRGNLATLFRYLIRAILGMSATELLIGQAVSYVTCLFSLSEIQFLRERNPNVVGSCSFLRRLKHLLRSRCFDCRFVVFYCFFYLQN